jgi:hypothetical protein
MTHKIHTKKHNKNYKKTLKKKFGGHIFIIPGNLLTKNNNKTPPPQQKTQTKKPPKTPTPPQPKTPTLPQPKTPTLPQPKTPTPSSTSSSGTPIDKINTVKSETYDDFLKNLDTAKEAKITKAFTYLFDEYKKINTTLNTKNDKINVPEFISFLKTTGGSNLIFLNRISENFIFKIDDISKHTYKDAIINAFRIMFDKYLENLGYIDLPNIPPDFPDVPNHSILPDVPKNTITNTKKVQLFREMIQIYETSLNTREKFNNNLTEYVNFIGKALIYLQQSANLLYQDDTELQFFYRIRKLTPVSQELENTYGFIKKLGFNNEQLNNKKTKKKSEQLDFIFCYNVIADNSNTPFGKEFFNQLKKIIYTNLIFNPDKKDSVTKINNFLKEFFKLFILYIIDNLTYQEFYRLKMIEPKK